MHELVSEATPKKPNNFDRVPKCGAKTRSGKPCQAPAMANGRCRMHRGKAGAGLAHYNFQGKGKYKDVIPVPLKEVFERAVESGPEMLDLTEEIALVQSRIYQILGNLETGESATRWRELREASKVLQAARRRGDKVTVAETMEQIMNLLSDAGKEFWIWDDLFKTIGSYQSLVRDEKKRRLEMHQLISTDQAQGLLADIIMVIRANVDETTCHQHTKVLMAIHNGIKEAVNKRPSFRDAY